MLNLALCCFQHKELRAVHAARRAMRASPRAARVPYEPRPPPYTPRAAAPCELACEPHWCHTSRRGCKLAAAAVSSADRGMNGGDGVGGGARWYAARSTLGVEVKPARTEEATVHSHSQTQ